MTVHRSVMSGEPPIEVLRKRRQIAADNGPAGSWSPLHRSHPRWTNPSLARVTRSGADGFDPPTTGWLRIDARKSTFSILPEMKSVLVRGFDSLVKRYKGYTISMNFDHGIFPG